MHEWLVLLQMTLAEALKDQTILESCDPELERYYVMKFPFLIIRASIVFYSGPHFPQCRAYESWSASLPTSPVTGTSFLLPPTIRTGARVGARHSSESAAS